MTPIQELYDKFYKSNIFRDEFTEWLNENKERLIEQEKDEIIKAFYEGYEPYSKNGNIINGLEYYNETYQNK